MTKSMPKIKIKYKEGPLLKARKNYFYWISQSSFQLKKKIRLARKMTIQRFLQSSINSTLRVKSIQVSNNLHCLIVLLQYLYLLGTRMSKSLTVHSATWSGSLNISVPKSTDIHCLLAAGVPGSCKWSFYNYG